MIIESLGSQHLSKLTPLSSALLDLGPLVLEPDFDLVLVQAQLVGQVFSPLLREVSVLLKFPLEPRQLI